MRQKHKTATSEEYVTFSDALSRVLRVSHAELKAKLEAEKQEKRKPKTSASAHASDEKD